MAKSPFSYSAQALPRRISHLVVEIRWLLQLAGVFFLFMVLLSYSPLDPSWTHAVQANGIANWGGRVGAWTADILLLLFGFSAYWWAVWLGRRVVLGYWRIAPADGQADDLSKSPPARAERRPADIQQEHGLLQEGSWLIELFSFALILIASVGLEAMRLWSLSTSLPRAPGGVLGDAVAAQVLHALGFTGGTLALLLLLAIGVSLFFRFSWLNVAERTGDGIVAALMFIQMHYEARRDRKVGEAAAIRREGKLEQDRVRVEEHEPVRIVPAASAVVKSERIEKEKQQTLFHDLPDSILPPLALLDAPLATQETVSADTLEFTSRLIEKKIKGFWS